MSIVVDASMIVAVLVDAGAQGTWAEELVAGHSLVAPELIYVEATNSLRRLELANQLSTAQASLAHADLMQLEIDMLPFEPFADRIWSLRRTISSYDAWYVAIAEALELPLATLDKRLRNATGPKCRFLVP